MRPSSVIWLIQFRIVLQGHIISHNLTQSLVFVILVFLFQSNLIKFLCPLSMLYPTGSIHRIRQNFHLIFFVDNNVQTFARTALCSVRVPEEFQRTIPRTGLINRGFSSPLKCLTHFNIDPSDKRNQLPHIIQHNLRYYSCKR